MLFSDFTSSEACSKHFDKLNPPNNGLGQRNNCRRSALKNHSGLVFVLYRPVICFSTFLFRIRYFHRRIAHMIVASGYYNVAPESVSKPPPIICKTMEWKTSCAPAELSGLGLLSIIAEWMLPSYTKGQLRCLTSERQILCSFLFHS
ncbi:hypothetical protein AcV5_001474 [Taiwanofungus camphoratus]|nr:hypothetical protein AcV5_001474 [Antrodia cinnamomea]